MTTTLDLGFISAATFCLPPFNHSYPEPSTVEPAIKIIIIVDWSRGKQGLCFTPASIWDAGDLAEQILAPHIHRTHTIGIDCVKMTTFLHSYQDNHGV